jgi:hypothetical protein
LGVFTPGALRFFVDLGVIDAGGVRLESEVSLSSSVIATFFAVGRTVRFEERVGVWVPLPEITLCFEEPAQQSQDCAEIAKMIRFSPVTDVLGADESQLPQGKCNKRATHWRQQ